jgi:hypothetical protein
MLRSLAERAVEDPSQVETASERLPTGCDREPSR